MKASSTEIVLSVSGLDVEDAILDVGVGAIVDVPLEFPVTTTAESLLMLPFLEVEGLEVILEDQSLGG